MKLSGYLPQPLKDNAMMISSPQAATRSNTPDDIPLLPAVPTALLLDKRLMPLERNAWMVLHASANVDGNVTGISYTQLRQFLACVPDNPQASRETVARTLTVLRLTRWIHIDAHVRNPLTGHLSTNHYTVHLVPLPIRTACELDLTWTDLLEQSFSHASTAVRQIASSVLTEVAADASLLQRMPIALRLRAQTMGLQASADGAGADDDSDPPAVFHSDETADRGSEKCLELDAPNSKVRSSFIKKNTYVLRAREDHPDSGTGDLRLPKHFQELALGQQRDVLCHLQRLAPPQRQQVLDEWSARCVLGKVLKPVAYLFGLIRKAIAGEFRLWAAQPKPPVAEVVNKPTAMVQQPETSRPASPELARMYLTQIKDILRIQSQKSVCQNQAGQNAVSCLGDGLPV
ncbi:STY4528 family pathogenicity island replication protein [Kerstersia gyiorum]|uniref:STY4528 family pathogenicity island replication protein n=1 Tax=Kerstersia gyiorum TaxID=206506 RepID=UPI002097A3C4|nr:STY4528 family pathogenicity island replication protein [Kerstersia gyiorum]MCO7636651.1 STY4528 family pathogenicity island replication protein [Pseudomonas sp. S 311-6]MCP1633218.1 hypothetical protein [Kerstersia gyiorum]MCP1636088.1 hypothetical protein [Kerstersia gyiorum]MCP1672220.1 hypothetical protein [Kerstersia gyiorum]MCP1680291.1 hypothetical protein [Kerstersia gyiorum]